MADHFVGVMFRSPSTGDMLADTTHNRAVARAIFGVPLDARIDFMEWTQQHTIWTLIVHGLLPCVAGRLLCVYVETNDG